MNRFDSYRTVWGLLAQEHVEELEATVRDGSVSLDERLEAVLVLIHNVRDNAATIQYDTED